MNKTEAASAPISDGEKPNDSLSFIRARALILDYGWNSTSYQIINPGIKRWFSSAGDAVVGFVSTGGARVVAGAPVCAQDRLPEVLAEFEADAADGGERICYFCAETRLESVYEHSPVHSKIILGAQPVWQPRNWGKIVGGEKSLRAQLNRARNKGVKVSEWSADRAKNNLSLEKCLREWLATKNLPPLGFLVEPNTLARIFDRRVFVAEKNSEVVGFVVLSPIAKRSGWLFEQFPHSPSAPNGTVELMIDASMRALAADGCEYATLGLSPLSTRANVVAFDNPFWLRVFLFWLRKHGQRFYNFDGLDRFKAKFRPERWEPVFALANEPRFSFKTLYAIASAFSQNAPFSLFFNGLWRAAKTETRWFKQKLRKNRRG